ncbi:MAG TPA: hydantoinase/oxoprolinase family protein [Xanthobacteraceae bacterium]|jgi:N-methylhydantoinase A|nr:hydantoinase/oxoprolinase family protein [Xanthobacteraceae bacterium]
MTADRYRYRLGVDVGGTHTDLVLLDTDTGELAVAKVASTPKNPALGVLEGLANFVAEGIPPSQIEFFAHGTTITTNALLEMRGAKVGLLITKGYRAVQEVQNQARDGNLFNYFYSKPTPIAPQSLTKEVPERCDYAGRVLQPLDKDAVRRAARELKHAGVQSIAVCYLFSFMNPRHEQETRTLLREEFPAVHVSLSSEVLPRIREWPRLSTTLLNAYLEPVIMEYVRHLNQGLDGAGLDTQQRFLMQSNGGVMPFSAAIAGGRTVHTLFSGPAAGAQASAHLAREDARRGLVTLDMGGTSADIAFIEGGTPLEVTESIIARRQVDVPALDMVTISAGGGSIAWVDGGFLNVGPHSAGADPGPACYARGGLEPTVTDADLVCGYLNPDYFLGGTHKLDVAAARATLKARIADPLHMEVVAAAAGIQRIVDMRMADEIRVFAAKRGVDLSAFTLLPFGGAGGVHAAAVAEELGMRRILVPPRPGAFSALGLLCTDVVHDYIRSDLRSLAEITAEHAEAIFRQLESAARAELDAEGMGVAGARFARELDLRYSGQGYELRIPLAGLFHDRLTPASLTAARERFDERHAQIHGHAANERPVEVVSYRLRVRVAVPKYAPLEIAAPASPRSAAAVKGQRTITLNGATMEATLYERARLDVGTSITGPAILEQFDATTLIPPSWSGRVDGHGNLVLTRA